MTLLMRDQENIEKGLEKGLKEGIEKGIKEGIETGIFGMISALRDLKIADDIILQKIQEKFNVPKEEAEKYLQETKSEV